MIDFEIKSFSNKISGAKVKSIRARELYKGLGLDQTSYARWQKKIVSEYSKNEDYAVIHMDYEHKKTYGLSNNVSTDVLLSIYTAKKIVLATRNTPLHIKKELIESMGLNYSDDDLHKFNCTENSMDLIVQNLFSDYKVIRQFTVPNTKYRLDWYVPSLNIAIECDEIGHKGTTVNDTEREREITAILKCTFIRKKFY